jgi:hypothetical protein
LSFVHGNSVAKGECGTQENNTNKSGKFVLESMPGDKIPIDKLTKLGTAAEH